MKGVFAALVVTAALSACGGSPETSNVAPAANAGPNQRVTSNVAPVADAGPNQSVIAGSTVITLDGSRSTDANGDSIQFAWTLTGKPPGSSAALSDPTSAKPAFTADLPGAYMASLVVNDGALNSNAASVTVTAAMANAAPVANAGSAQSVLTGAIVTLDGLSLIHI